VILAQHSDDGLVRRSADWRIVPKFTPDLSEPHVEKLCGDSFEDTLRESVLSGLGVGRLVVVGAQTDACVRLTTVRSPGDTTRPRDGRLAPS